MSEKRKNESVYSEWDISTEEEVTTPKEEVISESFTDEEVSSSNLKLNDELDLEIKDVVITDYALEINNLVKSYGKKQVLKGLNLKVKKGEVYGFIGKNGVGKSTTIDCIVGLKEANSGDILIMGKDAFRDPLETKMLTGYVPSVPTTYEMMTGNEYLQFIGSSYDMLQSAFDANYEYLLRKLSMSPADMNRPIKEYSHGMKQKVCLMASLIHNPKIWILDEPTVGLDIIVYEVLLKMIRDFANNGKTVFITSHSIDLVAKVCDRVAIVNNGVVELLIDLNKEPLKRRDLNKIFFKLYEESI